MRKNITWKELIGSNKKIMSGVMAAIIAVSGAGAVMNTLPIHASASYITEWSEAKDAIDDYFYELNYDENGFFVNNVDDENTTITQLVQSNDGSVKLVKKQKVEDTVTARAFGVSNADASNIYPGAMLKANESLITGNPEPVRLPRRDVAISIANAKIKPGTSSKTIANPTNASDMNDAVNRLCSNFNENTDFPAQFSAKIEKVESDQQIMAKMNLSQELWGKLKIDASTDYQNNKQAVVLDLSQVFYTISTDIQTSADLFPDDVQLNKIRREITGDTPAVVVSSIDYGKRIVACIQTEDTSFDLKAALNASGLSGKISADISGEYLNKLCKCTVNLCIIGGSSENAGKFLTTDIGGLLNAASKYTKYDGYAVPVSYTTRWAKSGKIASSYYRGYTWKVVSSETLNNSIPVKFGFDPGDQHDYLKKGSIDIYGKRIIGIDADGSYIKSDEQLIKHIDLDYRTEDNFNLPANVISDSVRFVFGYEGKDHTDFYNGGVIKMNEIRNYDSSDVKSIRLNIGIDKNTKSRYAEVALLKENGDVRGTSKVTDSGAVIKHTYIKDIIVVGYDKDSQAQAKMNELEKSGWSFLKYDLNKGAGGHFIYVGYQTTNDPNEAIRNIIVRDDGNRPNNTVVDDVNYTLCNYTGDSRFCGEKGDLNCKAGGADIMFYYTKDEVGDGKAVDSIFVDNCSVDAVSNCDLNRGAGGEYIFMHMTKYDA